MMRFFTGFGVNSLANMVAGGYLDALVGGSAAPTIVGGAGPFGENTLTYNSNGTFGYVQKNYGANIATIFIGFWFRLDAMSATPGYVLGLFDSTTCQVFLKLSSAGQFSFYSGTPGGSSTLLATNSAATLSLGKWTFVEIGVVFSTTVGSVEMQFNGADVISLTGSLNTAPSTNAYFSVLQLGQLANAGGAGQTFTWDFADLYSCDASGSYNTTFLGPGQVYTSLPTGNATTQFTGVPNTGTSTWKNVANNPSVGTDYNYSSTATQQDTFTPAAVPSSISSILATQLSAFWGLDAAGSRTAQVVFKSSSTTAKLPASPLTVGPGYSWGVAIEETDPNTSSPWTVAGLNAADIGYYLAT